MTERWVLFNFRCPWMLLWYLGVFFISVKPLTTENTENKTTPKICKIT